MDSVVSRILAAMLEKGYDQKRFAAEIEVSPQTITDSKKGKTNSYTRYIQKISELLEVSSDYLLTGQEAQTPAPEFAALVAKFEQLTPEQRGKVIGYMEGLLSSR